MNWIRGVLGLYIDQLVKPQQGDDDDPRVVKYVKKIT